MENKKYDVWFESRSEWVKVDIDWLKNVDLKNIDTLNLSCDEKVLECIYKTGKQIVYRKNYGTWSFPVHVC